MVFGANISCLRFLLYAQRPSSQAQLQVHVCPVLGCHQPFHGQDLCCILTSHEIQLSTTCGFWLFLPTTLRYQNSLVGSKVTMSQRHAHQSTVARHPLQEAHACRADQAWYDTPTNVYNIYVHVYVHVYVYVYCRFVRWWLCLRLCSCQYLWVSWCITATCILLYLLVYSHMRMNMQMHVLTYKYVSTRRDLKTISNFCCLNSY